MCASDVLRQTEVKGSDRTKASAQVGQALLSKRKEKKKKINVLLLSGHVALQQHTHSHMLQAAVVRLSDVNLSQQFKYTDILFSFLSSHERHGGMWVSELCLPVVRRSYDLLSCYG